MPSDKLDIGGSFRGQVSVAPEEHPEDRTARLRAEQRSALIEDCKGVAVFAVLLAGLVAIGILSAYESFFDSTASPDTRRWSQTILSALVTGGISFVAGRKMGK